MCARGRIDVHSALGEELSRLHLQASLNLKPTEPIPVVRFVAGQRQLGAMRWGLIPRWAAGPGKNPTFNARSESVATTPTFRDSFRDRRCLVVLDAFYEWSGEKGKRKAHLIHRTDGRALSLAGLWDRWVSPDGEVIESATVLTRSSTGAIAGLHDRMPLVLAPDEESQWLDPATEPARVQALTGVDHGADLTVQDAPEDFLQATVPAKKQMGLF